MAPEVVGIFCFVALVVFLVMGLPVLFAMLLVGMIGYTLIDGWHIMTQMVGVVAFKAIYTHAMTVVPLFVLIGNFAIHSRFAEDLFTAFRYWLSRLTGGLTHATIFSNALFAAATGSSAASSAVFTKLALPEMKRAGYDTTLAVGAVAGAGPLAAMIPPSLMMVIYALLTEASLGRLLIAGIIPGLMMTLIFVIMIAIRVRLNPKLAPPAGGVRWKLRFKSITSVWPMILVIVFILGSIYAGIATPTESAAIGVFGMLMIGIVMRRLGWRQIYDSLIDSALVSGMIMAIVMATSIFTHAITISGLPGIMAGFITGLPVAPVVIIILFMVMYAILGCFIPAIPLMYLTLPIIGPIIYLMGFNDIWFGILIVCVLELGAITPPFGICLFAVKGALPRDSDVSLGVIARGAVPFMICYIIALVILIAFPRIALFLPGMM